MSKEIEKEVRSMLDEDKYFEMVSFFLRIYPKTPFLNITNIYYDTPEHTIYNSNAVLRLRITNKKPQLTLKIGIDENTASEINQSLSEKQYHDLVHKSIFPLGEVLTKLNDYGQMIHKYEEIGRIKTKRLEIKTDDGLIVVDANTYLNIKDYNIEIECDEIDKGKKLLNRLSEQFKFKISDNYVTKFNRLMANVLK